MVILHCTQHRSLNPMKVSVQLTFGQKKIDVVLWKVKPTIWKAITCGSSKGDFLSIYKQNHKVSL